jgi:hypothetical protein
MLMSTSEEAHLIRPDQDDTPIVVKDEGATFVRSAPESLPHITVPDLAPDAAGMSAEALAQVPTLTEQVKASEPVLTEPELPAQEVMQVEVSHQESMPGADLPPMSMTLPQGLPSHVESWLQQCQSRINQLTNEIHKLNDRLDQIDHKPKA